jgi:hypothetical protein
VSIVSHMNMITSPLRLSQFGNFCGVLWFWEHRCLHVLRQFH